MRVSLTPNSLKVFEMIRLAWTSRKIRDVVEYEENYFMNHWVETLKIFIIESFLWFFEADVVIYELKPQLCSFLEWKRCSFKNENNFAGCLLKYYRMKS